MYEFRRCPPSAEGEGGRRYFGIGGDGQPLNVWRFVRREALRGNRVKVRFYERCRDTLLEAAYEKMREASRLHAELEEIYGAAMDYAAKEVFCRRLIAGILGSGGKKT